MKKLLLLPLVLTLASCVTVPYSNTNELDPWSHNASYGHQISEDIVRKGKVSERFEIRHGDCDYDDCTRDRRRIEYNKFGVPITDVTWFAWSIYLPKDFDTLESANTTLGQIKVLGPTQIPLVAVNARENDIRFHFQTPNYDETCVPVATDNIWLHRGKWIDIMVRLDFDTEFKENKKYAQVYVNGVSDKRCDIYNPVILGPKDDVYFRYGIYNSYVSRWFDQNKTKEVNLTEWTHKHGTYHTISSPTNKPWDIDWGVKLPTQVVHFDEVRLGPTRESVDINMNEAVD